MLIRDSLHGLDPLLRKTMLRVPYQHVEFEWRLPLWVNCGLSRPTAATSASRGEADPNGAKADIGAGVSDAGIF